MGKIKVTIWNENIHEKRMPEKMTHYPQGIHGAIRQALALDDDFDIRIALMDEAENGLPDAVLDDTDVLIWWGHVAHDQLSDKVAQKIISRVWDGMGLIALHASHKSKPMRMLLGTDCRLKWRVANDAERIWVIEPGHPIARGLPESFLLEHEEVYAERINYPRPDELIFISWYSGGEVGRTGNVWYRGNGRIFYFQPGHETFPSLNNKYVQQVLRNAARWASGK